MKLFILQTHNPCSKLLEQSLSCMRAYFLVWFVSFAIVKENGRMRFLQAVACGSLIGPDPFGFRTVAAFR